MEKTNYRINDLALMTRLSTRTIRNYIQKGLLHGTKEARGWTFSQEELTQFFEEPYIKESIAIKKMALILDFINNPYANRVCSIYDYLCEDEAEAECLCQQIITKIKDAEKESIQFTFAYNKRSQIARIIVQGEMKWVTQMMLDCIKDT